MIEYTKEELERFAPNDPVLDKLQEATERGDEEAEIRYFRQLILPAVSLLVMKETMGAEWVVEQRLNTSEAVRVFGEDWLERDDNDELAKRLYV
ncbi:hypothetical protein [Varunaivibrio sulfuroxidans]|uniref:Uncharacterized protein n=1 Tax=Varunaivibrio sulfuroxidans TaxID=1773489 RepID=A0A4R3J562_9PROT|nr:hypothetical protein [Varunaivibrio sulfuroxidans]TCS59953.1 hypothetical protein EDD55_1144 [Varunaivibrio sulfuroxidans]WES31763.1 hypothetical protein P3M64_05190 [Varunaivibrio sulfuroxidans]